MKYSEETLERKMKLRGSFERAFKRSGLSKSAAAQLMGVAGSSVGMWLSHKSHIRGGTVEEKVKEFIRAYPRKKGEPKPNGHAAGFELTEVATAPAQTGPPLIEQVDPAPKRTWCNVQFDWTQQSHAVLLEVQREVTNEISRRLHALPSK
jgi:hypothetical protein